MRTLTSPEITIGLEVEIAPSANKRLVRSPLKRSVDDNKIQNQ